MNHDYSYCSTVIPDVSVFNFSILKNKKGMKEITVEGYFRLKMFQKKVQE